MKKFLSTLFLFLFLCSCAHATTYYSWRYREHASDCTSIINGKERDLCFETDDAVLYKCEPSSGDCDTAAEWKRVSTPYWVDLAPNLKPESDGDGVVFYGSGGSNNCSIVHNNTNIVIDCTGTTKMTLDVPLEISGTDQTKTEYGFVSNNSAGADEAHDTIIKTANGTLECDAGDDTCTATSLDFQVPTANADDNDTSAASTAFVQAEIANLFYGEKNAWIETPAVESMDDFITGFMNDVLITYVKCKTDAGTVSLNLEDGSDNNILTAELVCNTEGQTSCSSGCDVNTINTAYDDITGKTEDIDVDISAVSNATRVSLMVGYYIKD